jgi:ketosteroid isomerase-like protein
MSASRDRQLVHELFEHLAVGNTRAFSDLMADDMRWVFPGNWSWSGIWEPKTVVLEQMLRPLMAQFADKWRCEADFIVADGDRVVVQARGFATTKRGDQYHQTYCYVFRIVDERITEVIEHCDTSLVDRVLDPIARVEATN